MQGDSNQAVVLTENDAGLAQKMVVVAIGASAGGLVAAQRLLDVMPTGQGMALILVQHLEPSHQSLMVDLLKSHTKMTVSEAAEGVLLEPDHVYVIPPGMNLAVHHGALVLSRPTTTHGSRLPFDFLLNALAAEFGRHAMCVVLSGTGADGSLGLRAIRSRHGYVIAQRPEEADYAGMPRNAIATGDIDQVLRIAEMPHAILTRAASVRETADDDERAEPDPAEDPRTTPAGGELGEVINLLRTQTPHDFTQYKSGTLERRVARRMAMVSPAVRDIAHYLERLRRSPDELELLAKDLLIHVTSFFRDPSVFELLATSTLPDLISRLAPGEKLRLWTPGCSTGEETYSLVILLLELMQAGAGDLKVQVFASDIDADAVAIAREGLYPSIIEQQVSPERLAQYFTREGTHYRVRADLRAAVIFTVQDLLSDPPFSRLDMISCRNLMIYLRPEAQTQVIAMFHFALRQDGILLLGNAETAGTHQGFFEVINKSAKLYRHVARSRGVDLGEAFAPDAARTPTPYTAVRPSGKPASRSVTLAEICRRMVLDAYAPAAILINRKYECLYSLGPVDHYLRMAPGVPSHDVLAMARLGMRAQLRLAVSKASETGELAVSTGHVTVHGGKTRFSIEVRPVAGDRSDLMLLCFVDTTTAASRSGIDAAEHDLSRVAELEHELESTRAELHNAIRNLELSSEEQSEINEEALSVNEEHQSTNEELLASKEELQSLNEELSALNNQLQETLERQRTTSNDLQNVLYSTNVATLFLDADLRIRFFTPAIRALFNLIPGDIGRPIADLNPILADSNISKASLQVIAGAPVHEFDHCLASGTWISRRILPYRTREGDVAGVVITYTDITARKRDSDALEAAMREADIANRAKSRFLAAASHDLRQPLQTLSLLQGALAKTVASPQSKALVVRLDEALSDVSGMLNTLLDINEIETGSVIAEMMEFPINDVLLRLREQFSFQAESQKLDFRVVSTSAVVRSDPRLLEQMLRNLLSNALKYTSKGKVLLGCRHHPHMLSVQVWDTGSGIAEAEHESIFLEYRQLNNAARDRSRGLGLGLSIVRQLANFLDHKVTIRSTMGAGSGFFIEIPMPSMPGQPVPVLPVARVITPAEPPALHIARILLVEDDLSVRDLLAELLASEGHQIRAAASGEAALAMVARRDFVPDLILTDYDLPNRMNGVAVVGRLRAELLWAIPAIVLTGDISKETLSNIKANHCIHLNKPMKLDELSATIQRLLRPAPTIAAPTTLPGIATIFIIDDDHGVRSAMRSVFELEGHSVETFASAEAFLLEPHDPPLGCLLVDAYLPGMSGLELLRLLTARGSKLPAIMITGHSDVPMAVEAMKSGAVDFIDKPATSAELVEAVGRALERLHSTSHESGKLKAWREAARHSVAGLTDRQREVMEMVLAGHPSKNIAADLGISQRTVENHRASIMRKTGSRSLPALARLALAAAEVSS